MRAAFSLLAAVLMVLLASEGLSRAGLETGATRAPALEVLVFEHPDCVYCRVFRRDVLPRYPQAMGAERAPLRFVDIATDDTASLGLNGRIEMVPTAVVMRDGHEVDRIAGYWGPTSFFQLLSRILTRME